MTTNYQISDVYKYKENLKPIEELKIYLEDIIIQIESELNIIINNSDGNCFNWRERKIPSFMNKFTSNDKIFLKINLEINKISDTNIVIISNTIEKLVETYINNSSNKSKLEHSADSNAENKEYNKQDYKQDNKEDNKQNNKEDNKNNNISEYQDTKDLIKNSYINECADYLTKNIYDKCYTQDISFSKNYINFFQNIKNKKLLDLIKINLKKKSDIFKDFIQLEDYSEYQFNNKQYVNIGYINGLLYDKDFLSSKESYNLLDLILKNIFSLLEWKPVDKDILEKKVNLLIGFLLASHQKLWNFFNTDTKQDIEHQIQCISNHNHIPNKIKYSIFDMNDKILDSLKIQEKEKKIQEKKERESKQKKYENQHVENIRNNKDNSRNNKDNRINNFHNNYHHNHNYGHNNGNNNGHNNYINKKNTNTERFNNVNKYNNYRFNREQNQSYNRNNQFRNKNNGINNRNNKNSKNRNYNKPNSETDNNTTINSVANNNTNSANYHNTNTNNSDNTTKNNNISNHTSNNSKNYRNNYKSKQKNYKNYRNDNDKDKKINIKDEKQNNNKT